MFKSCLFFLCTSYALYGVEGVYTGSGTDPYENTTYTVTATFTKDKHGVYQAVWDEIESGNKTQYIGTGLKQNNFISFIFQNTEDDSDKGLQIYKIKGDSLDGRFVSINKNLVGEEKISRSKK